MSNEITRFSDFIRNASVTEKEKVYKLVLERANKRQQEKLMSDRDVLKELRISENMPFFDPRVRGLFKDSADKIERLRAELEAVETEKRKIQNFVRAI